MSFSGVYQFSLHDAELNDSEVYIKRANGDVVKIEHMKEYKLDKDDIILTTGFIDANKIYQEIFFDNKEEDEERSS